MNENKIVSVCSNCLTAACMYGEFMCNSAKTAADVKMPIYELRKKGLENEEYWSDAKMLEIYGEPAPFGYEKIIEESEK